MHSNVKPTAPRPKRRRVRERHAAAGHSKGDVRVHRWEPPGGRVEGDLRGHPLGTTPKSAAVVDDAVAIVVDAVANLGRRARTPAHRNGRPAARGIATTAYGVLSRGLLTGSRPGGASDFRAHLPRFTGENGEKNRALADALARLAAARGVKPAQLAIAWVRAKAAAQKVTIIPTLGARTRAQLADTLAGLDVALSADEVGTLEAAVPADAVAGTRYAAPLMAALDSER